MKKTLLFLLSFLCLSFVANANFFLLPTVGIGAGKIRFRDDFNPPPNSVLIKIPFEYAVTFDARVDFGFQTGKFVLNSGLGYLRTGIREKYPSVDLAGNVVSYEDDRAYYNHIILPLQAGYKFGSEKRIAVIPAIGLDIAYNTFIKNVFPTGSGKKGYYIIKHKELTKNYHSISAFGHVNVSFEREFYPGLNVVITPGFYYMVTNMVKSEPYLNERQHNYTFLMNAGIKWKLGKKKNNSSETQPTNK